MMSAGKLTSAFWPAPFHPNHAVVVFQTVHLLSANAVKVSANFVSPPQRRYGIWEDRWPSPRHDGSEQFKATRPTERSPKRLSPSGRPAALPSESKRLFLMSHMWSRRSTSSVRRPLNLHHKEKPRLTVKKHSIIHVASKNLCRSRRPVMSSKRLMGGGSLPASTSPRILVPLPASGRHGCHNSFLSLSPLLTIPDPKIGRSPIYLSKSSGISGIWLLSWTQNSPLRASSPPSLNEALKTAATKGTTTAERC